MPLHGGTLNSDMNEKPGIKLETGTLHTGKTVAHRRTNGKILSVTALLLCLVPLFNGCQKLRTDSPYIEGLSIDNYPVVDGSTSTLPLNRVIACELMGLTYKWQENKSTSSASEWSIEPGIRGGLRKQFDRLVLSSKTHNSLINVIDGKADITLSARSLSPDEKEYALAKGVSLIETPIALDALVFIVYPLNPVTNLTTENIRDIYSGKVKNWSELGIEIEPGHPEYSKIRPFIRNANSGSQELMDMLIMKDLKYADFPEYKENLVFTMAGLIDAIAGNPFAIGYTVYYYNKFIIRPDKSYLKTIAIDGVAPAEKSIAARQYPHTTEVYAVIRSDTDRNSMAYKVYEWLQGDTGKEIISKSGYIPAP